MTNSPIFTPFLSPFDLVAVYASSFGAAAVLSRQAALMAHRESLNPTTPRPERRDMETLS
ncbi:MAG: hypothetical protein LDL37_15690 [Asticcacaulis sp.]|uniref:hypothetical protein n=1 Tax=Asticcacaulis sp. TaxID=1872648 RepID=UPI0025C512B3|nr:hypothetical protein [Asticcacaulis sp.]MCA1936887.1 hypothetical protein [Asticcacaulis sp.]